METLRLPATEADAMARAQAVLRAGGLVAFPTDTVYGVGALAFDGPAIEAIYAAKGRPAEKAIPILLSGQDQLDRVAVNIPRMAKLLGARFWPGPLTLIVPKLPALPEAVSATLTVAVRVPDHAVALTLLRLAGPMAVTSANMSGEDNPTTADSVMRQLGGRISLVLDGGTAPGGIPSTLVDCLGERPRLLREGPVSEEQIILALRDS